MLKYEGTDKIRDIKYEDGYVDKIYYDNNTLLVFTSDKEKTGVDEVLFKGRKLVDVTSYGKCEQNGTPTPDAPVDIVSNNGAVKWDSMNQRIYADGTPEVLTVGGVNLFDPNYYSGEGWYISNSNQVANAASNGTLVFPCKPNTTYSWWHTDGKGGERAFELTTDTVTVRQAATWAVGNPAYNDAMTVCKYTTSANAKLLCVLFARVDAEKVGRTKEEQLADFMLVEGDIEEVFAYQSYVIPQTASVVSLLSVGNYQDEQSIIDGEVTRKVGIKVLDGTENFTAMASAPNIFKFIFPDNRGAKGISPMCSHYHTIVAAQSVANMPDMSIKGHRTSANTYYIKDSRFSTVDEFKDWLADQYNAGTPVIVVYPLETPTTEQVLGQQLTIQQGNNTIEITQASIDDILLKVKYK